VLLREVAGPVSVLTLNRPGRRNSLSETMLTALSEALTEIAADPACADVKQVATFSGAAFLYSDSFLAEERVEALARHDELRAKAMTRIREDSQYSSTLTAFRSLAALAPDLKPGEIEGVLDETEETTHIKSMPGRNNEELFRQPPHVHNYARMLARVEANDPVTLFSTVRGVQSIPSPDQYRVFEVWGFQH
jgi:hypothetical protein